MHALLLRLPKTTTGCPVDPQHPCTPTLRTKEYVLDLQQHGRQTKLGAACCKGLSKQEPDLLNCLVGSSLHLRRKWSTETHHTTRTCTHTNYNLDLAAVDQFPVFLVGTNVPELDKLSAGIRQIRRVVSLFQCQLPGLGRQEIGTADLIYRCTAAAGGGSGLH